MPSKCHTALAAPGKCSVRKPPPLSRSNRPVKPHSSPAGTSTALGICLFVHTYEVTLTSAATVLRRRWTGKSLVLADSLMMMMHIWTRSQAC
jgi:hypothetical protein